MCYINKKFEILNKESWKIDENLFNQMNADEIIKSLINNRMALIVVKQIWSGLKILSIRSKLFERERKNRWEEWQKEHSVSELIKPSRKTKARVERNSTIYHAVEPGVEKGKVDMNGGSEWSNKLTKRTV